MADKLPIYQAIKVTPKSIIVGHPRQVVELLASGVATAIVKSKAKDNGSFSECLLRCQLLAPNVNLPVYFCLDHINQPLTLTDDNVILSIPTEEAMEDAHAQQYVDSERAKEWNDSMQLAISYWAVKAEEAVLALYPDRKPKQIDPFATRGVIEMRLNKQVKEFNAVEFLQMCERRSGFPVFKLSYIWIGSKEDQRSKDHIWGMKFDFSQYGQFPIMPRNRKPAVSAQERQEQLLKKRKTVDEEVATAAVDEKA